MLCTRLVGQAVVTGATGCQAWGSWVWPCTGQARTPGFGSGGRRADSAHCGEGAHTATPGPEWRKPGGLSAGRQLGGRQNLGSRQLSGWYPVRIYSAGNGSHWGALTGGYAIRFLWDKDLAGCWVWRGQGRTGGEPGHRFWNSPVSCGTKCAGAWILNFQSPKP